MTTASVPSDADLVRRATLGERSAFGELYDRYFPAVYDFLHRMTRNADEAADVAQDTFVRAMENLGALQKASSFKSWLFSIAHHQALNRLERGKRTTPASALGAGTEGDGEFDPLLQQVDPDRLADPEQATEARELASLVWEAAAGLDPRQYALLDLHVRQGLESAEIAEVLGVSKGNAYTMLNRMKKSVEEAIGAFLLARRGSKDCKELQRILAPADIPPVTPELRRSIDRHVRRCDICTRAKKAVLSPMEILGALAPVPVPIGLQSQIWGGLESRWPETAQAASEGAGSGAPPRDGVLLGRSGLSEIWKHWYAAIILGGAVLGALVAAAIILFGFGSSGADGEPFSLAMGGTGTPTVSTATATRTSTEKATSTPATPTRTATPGEVSPPAQEPTETPPVVVPPTEAPPRATPTQRPPTPRDTTPPDIQSVVTDAVRGIVFSANCGPNYQPQEVTITAEFADAGGIGRIVLGYRLADAPAVRLDLVRTSPASATIGPFYSGGTLIFWIEATDLSGNIALSEQLALEVEDCSYHY